MPQTIFCSRTTKLVKFHVKVTTMKVASSVLKVAPRSKRQKAHSCTVNKSAFLTADIECLSAITNLHLMTMTSKNIALAASGSHPINSWASWKLSRTKIYPTHVSQHQWRRCTAGPAILEVIYLNNHVTGHVHHVTTRVASNVTRDVTRQLSHDT